MPVGQPYTTEQMHDLPMPWWADAIGDIPGIPTVTAVNAGRTANTLIQGARGSGRRVGQFGGMFSQNLNPANLFRYSTDEFLHSPSATMGKGAAYTPYGAARMGNAIATWRGKTPVFEEAALGRITAASKIQNMSAAKFAEVSKTRAFQRSIYGAPKMAAGTGFQMSLPGMEMPVGNMKPPVLPKGAIPAAATQKQASRALLLQGGRVSGFVAEAQRYSNTARTIATSAAPKGAAAPAAKAAERGTQAALRGVSAARNLEAIALKGGFKGGAAKAALKGTTYLARGASFATPIGYIMLAYDIGKLGSKAIGYTAKLAGEAFESGFSGLNTPIGGNIHKDTEASLTSRSRGVQAIMNSRLNARSILGAEAGAMSSYYG